MKHDYIYNHLNAEEFLIVQRSAQWQQILKAIQEIDANRFLKISKDQTRKGEVLYNQVAINNEFKRILTESGWKEMKTEYYVTGDIPTAKDVVREKDSAIQKRTIEERGHTAFSTYNQVDFVKDRIAVEVQFGKYFSVAYDLHVKHTFFFLRDEIDVGIEIIPTHAMMRRMDTGVSWFENEVTNVIREGRNNPSVPIVIIGIEPDDLIPETNATKRAETARKRVDKAREKKNKAEATLEKKKNARMPNVEKILEAEAKLNECIRELSVAEKEFHEAQIESQRTDELKALLRNE